MDGNIPFPGPEVTGLFLSDYIRRDFTGLVSVDSLPVFVCFGVVWKMRRSVRSDARSLLPLLPEILLEIRSRMFCYSFTLEPSLTSSFLSEEEDDEDEEDEEEEEELVSFLISCCLILMSLSAVGRGPFGVHFPPVFTWLALWLSQQPIFTIYNIYSSDPNQRIYSAVRPNNLRRQHLSIKKQQHGCQNLGIITS